MKRYRSTQGHQQATCPHGMRARQVQITRTPTPSAREVGSSGLSGYCASPLCMIEGFTVASWSGRGRGGGGGGGGDIWRVARKAQRTRSRCSRGVQCGVWQGIYTFAQRALHSLLLLRSIPTATPRCHNQGANTKLEGNRRCMHGRRWVRGTQVRPPGSPSPCRRRQSRCTPASDSPCPPRRGATQGPSERT